MNINNKKENQHFVPKFYLKNFSFEENLKEIGIYNIHSKFFKERVGIKHQSSKKYFYGKDGEVEEFLGFVEDKSAPIIKKIILENQVPQFLSQNHYDLLYFFIILECRNPTHINSLRASLEQGFEKIKTYDPNFLKSQKNSEYDEFMSNENLHRLIVNESFNKTHLNMDLNFKIMVNNSDFPFITSDFPIVRYNQLMEKFLWDFGYYSGNGWAGDQIFIPLNHKYMIVFYDSSIYKLGNNKEKYVNINENDIHSLNTLQYLNCFQNVYFNHKASLNYIEKLNKLSIKYERGHKVITKEFKDPYDKNSLIIGQTINNIKIDLSVSKMKIHSVGRNFKPTNQIVQFRKKSKLVFDSFKYSLNH